MSWKAVNWANEQTAGSPTAKLVLLQCAQLADERNISWPSLGKLAEHCECSKASVRRKLAALEERGLIVRFARHRENKSQTSDEIRLQMPGENAENQHTPP